MWKVKNDHENLLHSITEAVLLIDMRIKMQKSRSDSFNKILGYIMWNSSTSVDKYCIFFSQLRKTNTFCKTEVAISTVVVSVIFTRRSCLKELAMVHDGGSGLRLYGGSAVKL